MKIFCIAEFKVEFEKLKDKKSYNSIESDIINYFFDKSAQELSSGNDLYILTLNIERKNIIFTKS